MTPLFKILSVAIPAVAVISISVLSLLYFCCCNRHRRSGPHSSPDRAPPNQSSLRFHHLSSSAITAAQTTPLSFSWDAHPRVLSQLVEHGWSMFIFADRSSVPRSSPLWTLCAACDAGAAVASPQVIKWDGFMQTVRIGASSVTRMSLPLPGPPLVGLSFPQEAYFEITIAKVQRPKESKDGEDSENDRLKLIETNGDSTEREITKPLILLGLTTAASDNKLIPGTYAGSVGFRSDGSVNLDGMKLVSESTNAEWATDKVIGCGFSPIRKKVYFTVDSELVHVIRCHSDIYRSPLYPVLAANSDTTVVVNLGQAPFKYAPANTQRTSNPCFLQSSPCLSCHSVGAYDDSREFFTVAMPDADDRAVNNQSPVVDNNKSSKRSRHNWDEESVMTDIDKESDLFEIALNY